jgi:hypothetical protein
MASTPEQEPSSDVARRHLVQALARLSEDERRRVIADAQREAGRRATLDWKSMRAARGIVSLGGNAVADCDTLYDG